MAIFDEQMNTDLWLWAEYPQARTVSAAVVLEFDDDLPMPGTEPGSDDCPNCRRLRPTQDG